MDWIDSLAVLWPQLLMFAPMFFWPNSCACANLWRDNCYQPEVQWSITLSLTCNGTDLSGTYVFSPYSVDINVDDCTWICATPFSSVDWKLKFAMSGYPNLTSSITSGIWVDDSFNEASYAATRSMTKIYLCLNIHARSVIRARDLHRNWPSTIDVSPVP